MQVPGIEMEVHIHIEKDSLIDIQFIGVVGVNKSLKSLSLFYTSTTGLQH